ncbi:MAG: hypothetical protein IKX85_02355, partial [Clostridia bacterium]|nr:hypothetical protein [Clostridia bacterium]
MLFRKPYKILLASLANLLVLLFTVVEGVQMIGTQAEMESAAASRIYTGTVGYLLTKNSSGQEIPDRESTVSAEALEILSSSPYVDSVSFARRRTARFGGGKRYVQGDAAEYSMFVGVA